MNAATVTCRSGRDRNARLHVARHDRFSLIAAPIALILVMLLLPAVSMAQAAPADETPVFRSDTTLVLVRFQVVGKKQYVLDLQSADIELFEDGKLNSNGC